MQVVSSILHSNVNWRRPANLHARKTRTWETHQKIWPDKDMCIYILLEPPCIGAAAYLVGNVTPFHLRLDPKAYRRRFCCRQMAKGTGLICLLSWPLSRCEVSCGLETQAQVSANHKSVTLNTFFRNAKKQLVFTRLWSLLASQSTLQIDSFYAWPFNSVGRQVNGSIINLRNKNEKSQ